MKTKLFAFLLAVACAVPSYGQVFLRQSTASQELPLGRFVDSVDGDSEETGLTIANTDIKLWKTGATASASKNSGGATHDSKGMYYCVLDATDTNTIGPMKVEVHVSGALANSVTCCVLDEAVYDSLFGVGVPTVNTTQWNGTSVTGGDPMAALNRIGPATWSNAPTTFAFVARNYAGSATGINVSTTATNMTGASLFVACINSLTTGTPVLSDSEYNTWTTYTTTDFGGVRHIFYYCVKPKVSATQTFTATTAGLSPSIFVAGFSGVNSISPIDQESHATATATTVQPGSLTPSDNNYLVLTSQGNFGSGTPSVNSGVTYQSLATNASGNHLGGGLGYVIQTTASAINPTWTIGSASAHIATQVTFQVNTSTTTLGLASFENRRVFQREVDETGAQTHKKRVTFTGDYTAVTPASVEIQTYEYGSTTAIVQPYTRLENFQAAAGAWSGECEIPEGGWYSFRARSKNVAGDTLFSSNYSNGRAGVGIVVFDTGQSNAYKMHDAFGTPPTASDLTGGFVAGHWGGLTGNGAITYANKMTAATGLPIGVANYAVSGTGLVYDAGAGYWLDTAGGSPWALCEAGIAAAGGDVEIVHWQGCEADAENASFDGDTLKTGFDTLHSRWLDELPPARSTANFHFGIGMLATLTDSLTTDARVTAVRDALREQGDETPGFSLLDNTVDATMLDAFHYDGATYTRKGQRWAQSDLQRLGYETKSGVGPRIFNAYRVSGSADVYVQLIDLASDSLVELDGTTDGGSLTGFELSDDAFATNLTISSTAIVGNKVRLTLSAVPADGDSVVCRYFYGKAPTKTNLPYRGFNPQGDTRGLPLLPKSSFAVELRSAVATTNYLAQTTLNKRLPIDYGYKMLGGDGASLAARSTANISVLSETETSATLGTYFTPPLGFVDSGGYLVWDNGSAETLNQIETIVNDGTVPAQVHNQEPIPAFTSKVSTRADAVMTAYPVQRIIPGEINQIWIDLSPQLRNNIENVTSTTSTSSTMTITSAGMYGKDVSIVIDATSASDGDTGTITGFAQPFAGQRRKFILPIEAHAQ